VQWGWRIPFLVGAALAGAFLIYYWKTVEESRLWQDATKDEKVAAPMKVLFSGKNFRVLAQVFLMMTGFWFITQMTATYMVPFLVTVMKLPAATVNLAFLFANIGLGLGFLTYSALGQRHGRRPWLIVGGLLPMTLGVVLYYLFISNVHAGGSLILTLALAAAGFVVVGSAWGMPTTYITERFPTGIRSSAYGVGYSLAVVVPSLFNFYLLGLAKFMPYDYTLLVLVFLGGLLLTIGAWIGPETRDVEFTARAFEVKERVTPEQASPRPAVE
jgi:MFS family permease